MRYSAFISYSHEVDVQLARRLRSALQTFAKPWHRLRAVRVFQDSSSLAPDPSLWNSVRTALDSSEYFILLTSPEAANSTWVDREIRHWLRTRDLDTVLLVLTRGEIRWDATHDRFDAEVTDALPKSLRDAYTSEPLYLDLRWAENAEHLSLRHPQFRDAAATLQSVLRSRPKDELIGEDVRSHRNARRLAWSGGTVVAVLAIAAALAALVADQQRQEAERQRDTANARLLGVQAEQLLDQNPELLTRSVLLAIEAVRKGAGPQAEQALRNGLSLLPRMAAQIAVAEKLGDVTALAFDSHGERVLIGGDRGLGMWDIARGEMLQFAEGGRFHNLAMAGDGQSVWGLQSNSISRFALENLQSLTLLHQLPTDRGVLGGGKPGWFAWPGDDGSVVVKALEPDAARIRLAPPPRSGERNRVLAIAKYQGGNVVAAIGAEREIDVWSLPEATHLRTIAGPSEVSYRQSLIAMSPNGEHLAAVRGGNAVELWRLDDGTPLRQINHGSDVAKLQFAPDGRTLATAGYRSVRIWDIDGHELFRIPYEQDIKQMTFSADGGLLAIAHWDNAPVTIWDLAADRAGKITIPAERVNGVALSPSARYLATAEDDGVARVWDLQSGREIQRLAHPPDGYENNVSWLVFSPEETELTATSTSGDSTIWSLGGAEQIAHLYAEGIRYSSRLGPNGSLIAGSPDSYQTQVWNVRTGERVAQIGHEGSSWRPLISPDSRLVAVKRKSELFVYSLSTGEQIAHLEIDPKFEIKDVVFSPDARLLLAGGEDEMLTVWDVAGNVSIARVPHDETISHIAVGQDGSVVSTATVTGRVRVFATDDWRELMRREHPALLADVDIGVSRIATADEARVVRVWDIESGELQSEVPYGDEIQLVSIRPGSDLVGIAGRRTLAAIAVGTDEPVLQRRYHPQVTTYEHSKSGRYVAVGLMDGDIEVWDLVDGVPVLDVRGQGAPADVDQVAFSDDGERLISLAHAVHIWDLATGSEIGRTSLGSFGGAADLSPDGTRLAVGDSSSDLTVWDVATVEPVMSANHDSMITSVAISPDGDFVAATGPPSTVARVWRISDSDVVRTIAVDASNGLLKVAFHPDGDRIMTAGRDGSVRFWRLGDGAEVGRLLQGNTILDLDLTADGRFMATTSADYVVRVWSLESNSLVGLVPHAAATQSLALGTDGKLLATVDANNQLSVWRLDQERLLADACERVDRNLRWDEWQQYLGDAAYRRTCTERPLHASFMQAAFEMAQNGEPRQAREQLLRAQELDPTMHLAVDEELLAMSRHLDSHGESLAKKEEFAQAVRSFEAAAQLAGADPYDYEQRARLLATDEKLEAAMDLVRAEQTDEALDLIGQAISIDPSIEIPVSAWNSLCWYGTVYGHADKVLGACDKSVDLAGDDVRGFVADSRGVARIVVGDTAGAIADFETLIAWTADKEAFAELAVERQQWIDALSAGKNPLEGLNLVAHSNYMAGYRMELGMPWQFVNIE